MDAGPSLSGDADNMRCAFRADGLSAGAHPLMIEVLSNNGSHVVVDAFDVH